MADTWWPGPIIQSFSSISEPESRRQVGGTASNEPKKNWHFSELHQVLILRWTVLVITVPVLEKIINFENFEVWIHSRIDELTVFHNLSFYSSKLSWRSCWMQRHEAIGFFVARSRLGEVPRAGCRLFDLNRLRYFFAIRSPQEQPDIAWKVGFVHGCFFKSPNDWVLFLVVCEKMKLPPAAT